MISAGTQNEFVEDLRWSPISGVSRPASAFPRMRDSEINRPRGDVGAESTLVGADVWPGQPRLQQRSRSSFGSISAIDALHSWARILEATATTEKIVVGRKPNCDRETMIFAARAPNAPSCGPDCRTPCRSAARAPHERFVDVTPFSLRRLRPLQRLVSRPYSAAATSSLRPFCPRQRRRPFQRPP